MQYIDMNALQSDYLDDLKIIGFPCNQFWIQEPGATGLEIFNGIKYVRPGGGFVPNFQLFKKIEVAGENQHPLYKYLVKNCPPTRNYYKPVDRLRYRPIMQNDIRWNWEKFLVGRDGRVIKRYDGGTKPWEIEDDIREAIGLKPKPKPPPIPEPPPKMESPISMSEPEPLQSGPRKTKKYYPLFKKNFKDSYKNSFKNKNFKIDQQGRP